MINRVLHSPIVRLVRGLVGTVVFVQASQFATPAGVLAMALGAALIITAGADVAPRPAEHAGNA